MSNTAEKFYDDQRKKGLTDKITINPEPDYSLPFYQEIFDLMDRFAKLKISKLELTQVPVGDDTPLSRCLKRISELEKENQELRELLDKCKLWIENCNKHAGILKSLKP